MTTEKMIFTALSSIVALGFGYQTLLLWFWPERLRKEALMQIAFEDKVKTSWPWKSSNLQIRYWWINTAWWIWYQRLVYTLLTLVLAGFVYLIISQ